MIAWVAFELLRFSWLWGFWGFPNFWEIDNLQTSAQLLTKGLDFKKIFINNTRFFNHTKFQTILTIQSYFTETSIKIYILKFCKNISRHIVILWVTFGHDIVYRFWVIKIFLFLGSVLFWSVKCTSVQKRLEQYVFLLFLTHWEFQKCITLACNQKFAPTQFFEH